MAFVLRPQSDLVESIVAEKEKLIIKSNSSGAGPHLGAPIVDQKIKNLNLVNSDVTELQAGYSRVKINFSESYKKKSEKELVFTIIIYKDHQAIYRSEKMANQYLDLQFKIEDTYQFYLFLEDEMSYVERKILEPETIIECQPKKNAKKIVVKNDSQLLFTNFRLGVFSFNKNYSFRWLEENDSTYNEFTLYPGVNFPPDHNQCEMSIANENGYFTFLKSFEEIYNDKPLEIELTILKAINVKIIKNEEPLEYQLSFIPDKHVQFKNGAQEDFEIKFTNKSFYTNCDYCMIKLVAVKNIISKFLLLKENFSQVEFNLVDSFDKGRRIKIKNNPYEENLYLFCYYDEELSQNFLGKAFGYYNPLSRKSADVFEMPNIKKDVNEILFLDIITKENSQEKENSNNKLPPPKRFGFLAANLFCGNQEEEIEIDFANLKFNNIVLKSETPDQEPIYILSLAQKFIQDINLITNNSELEYNLLLKQGPYRIISYDKKKEIIFSQDIEVHKDEVILITNNFKELIIPNDSNNKSDSDNDYEGIYVSYKHEVPIRNSLFQLLKDLNCGAKIQPNYKYLKQDISFFIVFKGGENIHVKFLDQESTEANDNELNPSKKYMKKLIDSQMLKNSQILFGKSFAPIRSDYQIINSIFNIAKEGKNTDRLEDENYKKHIFLNNFEYLILPPINKPDEKIQKDHYGKVVIRFNNPQHHLFSFEVLDSNGQIQNTSFSDFMIFDSHYFYLDNITNGNSFEFNFLEFGAHQLEVSDLTTGSTFKYPFQVSEIYQEIEVR